MAIADEIGDIVEQKTRKVVSENKTEFPREMDVIVTNWPEKEERKEVEKVEVVNFPEQKAPIVKVESPKIPAPIVNVEQDLSGLSTELKNLAKRLDILIEKEIPFTEFDYDRLEEIYKKHRPSGGGAVGPSKLFFRRPLDGKAVDPGFPYRLRHAEDKVFNTYGDIVSVENKKKTLRKFGRNADIGTGFETIWRTGGDETYATTNAIDKISSSDNGDTQSVVIEGHTISSGILTFVTQTVTLVGQTETALTTPLARCTRLYNNGTSNFAGTIYVYEDDTVDAGVPQTAAKIHLTVAGGNQSEKASTSISNNDYWFITEFTGYCFDKAAAVVEFEIQIREVGTTNKVFRRIYETAGTNGTPTNEQFDPVIIVPKNHDVRVRAVADNATTDIGATMSGYLASVS